MGENIDEVSYWDAWYFVDAFKGSNNWINSDGSSTPIDTDASGWVRSLRSGQSVNTIIFSDLNPPQGQYIVLYEGEGTIEYSGYAVKDNVASRRGRDVVNVSPRMNDFFFLYITALPNPSNYLKNIRVLMPDRVGGSGSVFEGNYATQIFHPLFLERIKRYSTLRLAGWMLDQNTQNPRPQIWENRPKVTDARWSRSDNQVPVEIMVNLANRLHADLWVCVPHVADENYIRQFASYVERNLTRSLRVYVEYSNEVWNDMFPQCGFARQQGRALSSDIEEAGHRYYAQRSVEIFRIWSGIFGSSARQRIVRVLASHHEQPGVGITIMDWNNAYREADALAFGAYFGNITGNPVERNRIRNFTPEQLIRDLQRNTTSESSIPTTIRYAQENIGNARARGLSPIVYEGGQHLVDFNDRNPNSDINILFDAANRHPLMGDAYTQLFNSWKSIGGRHFCHAYAVGRYGAGGRWGALETLSQERSPKYDALMNFISGNPRWW